MERNNRKKSFKSNKGITLIALIVTIVILLILVGTGLSVLIDGNAVKRAEDAVDKGNDRIGKEQGILDEALDEWGDLAQGLCSHEGEWITTKEATCTEKGIMTRTCTKCGIVQTLEIAKASHTFENGVCTVCGTIYCAHNYGNWQTVKEATCTEKGTQKRTCSKCGEEETKEIEAVGHNYQKPAGAGTKFTETAEYSDGTNTAVIPAGFTVSGVGKTCTKCGATTVITENIIAEGLVIYLIDDKTDSEIEAIDWTNGTTVANLQKTYDQFVWIPMLKENINDMYMCQSEDGTKSCKITVQTVNGENKAYCTTHSSTAMAGRLYDSSTENNYTPNLSTQTYNANSGLREPAVVTGNGNGDGTSYDGSTTYLAQLNGILGTSYASASDLMTDLQSEYNEIVKSVYQNQGFYIGRYETSGMKNSNTNATIKVVAGSDNSTNSNISNVTWYRMYAQQKKYAENKGLTSSIESTMIQGAAYDQVMKFIDPTTSFVNTRGRVEHSSSSNWSRYPYQTGGLNYYKVYPGNVDYNDVAKNIFDLEGNVFAWTTEATNFVSRTLRGSTYYSTSFVTCARGGTSPDDSAPGYGAMCQLYIIPPTLITFTLNGTEYTAVEGMTWKAWVNSAYNTGEWTIMGENIVDGINAVMNYVMLNGEKINISDKIISNQQYGAYNPDNAA